MRPVRNRAQHYHGSSEDVIVPEPQHDESARRKVLIPHRITLTARGTVVLAAVQFHDEIELQAREVSKVRADRMLSPEAQVHEPAAPKVKPDQRFRARLLAAQ
jgi:hypothetical protein